MTIKRIKNKLIRTFFDEQWSILVCNKKGEILIHIAPPKDRFWADPFPVEYNNKIFIFLEQQIGSGNGTVGFIELYPDLQYSDYIPILEKPYHLSYPAVFNHKEEWYLVPESHDNKTIDLYKAAKFPTTWDHAITLINNIDANDSTLFFYDSTWWLFTSIGTKNSHANTNLSLFYSSVLLSNNWIPHPQNPVCKGLTNSRMAGNIICKNGKLFRPAQNCRQNYGKETNINEILELTKTKYKEKMIKTIKPENNYKAVCTHTINLTENFILRDIKTRKLKAF